ncbi:hypothetical protein [Erwinia sorbitola]|uniref:Uncharacterized protein n=1 Tax=Erwinia sorbitola TaxID=2681984 RepID=A0ABW9R8H0_9GAMM|nr:hypothetical protein [Erwinia sorbitola]MTD26435.1 hypothetical protein [Erwinia sorbitola]
MEFRPFYLYSNRITYFNDFTSKNVDYELVIQQIIHQDDSSICLHDGFIFSRNGTYEVSFDVRYNRENNAHAFTSPEDEICAIKVIRHVEKAVIAHYIKYQAGMYLFLAADAKLSQIYQRIVRKSFATGNTLESGFQPNRRGYVIRTPQCYL